MSKYRAIKTTVDNITFDSKREAARYGELKLLFRTRAISNLEIQPEFHFRLENKKMFTYRADFSYYDEQQKKYVVEDVKGVRTPVYRLKKKIIEAVHGIRITEI